MWWKIGAGMWARVGARRYLWRRGMGRSHVHVVTVAVVDRLSAAGVWAEIVLANITVAPPLSKAVALSAQIFWPKRNAIICKVREKPI